MALVEANRVLDTFLTMFEEQRPVYNTIIQYYLGERKFISYFKGIRKAIPESNLPSLEIGLTGDTLGWYATRTQEDNVSLEVHITTSNKDPVTAIDLEGKLVALTTRILTIPSHLRPQIQGMNAWLLDSGLPSVTYGSSQATGNIRIAKITWQTKNLEYLGDNLFSPMLQGGGTWNL